MTRAEEKAKEYANNFMLSVDHENDVRDAYWDGYSQAEKDTIDRACKWLIDTGYANIIAFERFKEAMGKEETE